MIIRGCARKFPFGFASALIATITLIAVDAASDDNFDIVFFGGTVIDGTGAPAYAADVGIRGDKIAEIGDLSGSEADAFVDARGLTVDIHVPPRNWVCRSDARTASAGRVCPRSCREWKT